MKTKLYLSLFLILSTSFNSFPQIGFEENVIIDYTYGTHRATDVMTVDIDSDGDMDVLSASAGDDKIAWYENIDGSGTFGPQQVITTNAGDAQSVYACDIDGDGDMDVLSAYDSDIAWYENINGGGDFGSQQVITTIASWIVSVYACDIDGDGDMDVLSASYNDDKIAWYKNIDGQGTFGPQQIITTDANGAFSVYAGDIDGDGDMDVLSASYNDDKIAWFKNTDGMGTFDPQQIITTNTNGAKAVYSCDIDGDGYMDVLSASAFDNKIAWYKNTDGAGNFGSQQIITTNADWANCVYAGDIDGDGDLDVLSASYNDDKIAWYQNIDGQGTFGSQQIITIDTNKARAVYASDIDGDGDMDVFSASWDDNKIAWYKNTDGEGTFGFQQLITTNVDDPRYVYASDIDGDGDMDVLSASAFDNKIAWYKNIDGAGTFSSQQLITTNANGARAVYASDLDGDGNMDVLSASFDDDKIAWYVNTDGMGAFGSQQVITANADGATSVYAIDIDGDDDMDVLSASWDDNIIAWYKNIDGVGTFSSQQIITTNISDATSVHACDIDGDGDMDVLSTSWGYYSTVWFENIDGAGTFSSQQVISTVSSAFSVYACDIDTDGDMDVLTAYNDKIIWFENTDGEGDFVFKQTITYNVEYARSVYACDIDGDADMDVLSASAGDNKIAWYQNTDGLGTFGPQQVITTNAEGAYCVYADDLDGDGNMDVLSASSFDNKIAWYKNLGPLAVNENPTENLYIYPNPTTGILTVSSKTSIAQIVIYNNLGQLILRNSNKNSIDLSTLEQGLYFVKLEDIKGYFDVKKVIKK